MDEFARNPRLRKEAGLRRLEPLLAELRAIDGLKERGAGVFCCKSRAFLHFHYYPSRDIVADIRLSAA